MSQLKYVSDQTFNLTRVKKGKGFRYQTVDGATLSDLEMLERTKKLVIPPAWTEVKICDDEWGHIQAVGFDARGRKQYIYHPQWVEAQQQQKFDKMTTFGTVLPTLRETISADLRRHTLSKERVVATVVWLLDNTLIRVGNKIYAKDNNSFGLTTLREKHVEVEGNRLQFSFKGKSGVYHEVDVQHPRVAKTIQQCIDLPGYEIFQYLDDEKNRQVVDSRDVNDYLHGITGEHLSAKDFRTWGGTTLAATTLQEFGGAESETELKRQLTQTVKTVAEHLRNTPAICRKYYIHPIIIETYTEGTLVPYFTKMLAKDFSQSLLTAEEEATLAVLKK